MIEFAVPKKLKLGAHTYKIITKELDDDFGSIDRLKNIIYIDSRLPDTQLLATLVHEILHALNNETQHERVDGLAEQLTQVLVDNKILKITNEGLRSNKKLKGES